MPLYLIAYDLKDKDSDAYAEIEKALESIGAKRVLESVWTLDSPDGMQDVESIGRRLELVIHKEDEILVVETTGPVHRPKRTSELLKKRRDNLKDEAKTP